MRLIKRRDVPEQARTATHKHYKGGWYEAIGEATHTETSETLVIYRHVWPHASKLYARPKAMFYQTMADGRRRFEPIEGTIE